jgi:hypothetical protein
VPPNFDGTDVYPVSSASLNAPADLTSAKVTLSSAYVVGNTWVSGGDATVVLTFGLAGFPLQLPISHAVITMDLSAAHTGAVNGTLAGVISTAAMSEAMRTLAASFDPSLCSGPTIDSIVAQIEQASDILADGTQDPTRDCDGISIGLGFEATVVQLGAIQDPPAGPADPCAP